MSVPATALLPKDNSVTWSTAGSYIGTDVVDQKDFLGPVFLPHGAIIRKVTLEAHDNSTDGFVRARVVEYKYNALISLISELQTSNPLADGDQRIESSPLSHEIDNSDYSYGVGITLHNGTAGAWSTLFYKIIIEYEYDTKNTVVVIPLG